VPPPLRALVGGWLCRRALQKWAADAHHCPRLFQTTTPSGKEEPVRVTKMAHSRLHEASRAPHKSVGERRAEALVEAGR